MVSRYVPAVRHELRNYSDISMQDADEFEQAIERILEPLDTAELASVCLSSPLPSHPGVQISFNRSGEPFIGHSRGYNNENKPPRLYIRDRSRVLTQARLWLKLSGRRVPGGRVFLASTGVRTDFALIGRWNWPAASPERRINEMYFRLLGSAMKSRLSGVTAHAPADGAALMPERRW